MNPPRTDLDYPKIHDQLVSWFKKNQRDLPWRRHYKPYEVWISEIMLQQTRVEAMLPYYQRWMAELPDIPSVAGASPERLMKLWEGLGYYRRVHNIKLAAERLVLDHGGSLPADRKELTKLPGIGTYTSAAIASIAFDLPEPLLDGNVSRLYSRLCGWDREIGTKESTNFFESISTRLLTQGEPRLFNQSLMEMGALVCKPQSPDCENCPLKKNCQANLRSLQKDLPVKKRKTTLEKQMVFWVVCYRNRYLIKTRPTGELWSGMPCFLGTEFHERPNPTSIEDSLNSLWANLGLRFSPLNQMTCFHTRYKIQVQSVLVAVNKSQKQAIDLLEPQGRWVDLAGLQELTMPKPGREIREILMKN